jgi:protein TonB
MAPLLKEKTEAVTNGAEQTGSPAIPLGRVASDHLSADAVSLEVPVNIHGSRVTEAVKGATPHTEPFEEQTTTMIVFPQGGVLRMATAVTAGQMLVLTNLKSRQDAICRVVKVRTYSSVASYVEVEFTHPQAGYWGVFFSSDGPELAKKASGNLSLESLEPAPEFKPVPVSPVAATPSIAPLPRQVKDINAPSTLGIPANRNESSFISIGSQEEVQLSATSTTFKSGPSATLENQRPVSAPQKDQSAEVQPPRTILETREPRAPLDTATAMESPNAREEKSSAATVSTQNSAGTFGDVFGGSSRQITSRDAPNLGLESGISSASPSSSQNWKLLAGGAILGIVVAAGAFFVFRPSGNGNTTAKPAASAAAEVQPVATRPAEPVTQPSPSTPTHSATPSASSAPPKNNLVAEAKRLEPAAESVVKTAKPDEAPQAEPARPAPAAKHNVPDVTSDLFGSLNAHPVAGRTAEKNPAEIAPTVSSPAPLSVAGTPEIIPGPSTVDLPVPSQVIPGTVLQAGGSVPEPRLLSSTLPVYPAAAKQTRTQGDIVMRTVIDERGQVTNPQVVSGPTLLRESAIDAVKHWKYEPSHVNGKAVPVQILLTIHFRL